jgi:hypothetical protein
MSVILFGLFFVIDQSEPVDKLYKFERLYSAGVHLTRKVLSCGFWVSEGLERKFSKLVQCGVCSSSSLSAFEAYRSGSE